MKESKPPFVLHRTIAYRSQDKELLLRQMEHSVKEGHATLPNGIEIHTTTFGFENWEIQDLDPIRDALFSTGLMGSDARRGSDPWSQPSEDREHFERLRRAVEQLGSDPLAESIAYLLNQLGRQP